VEIRLLFAFHKTAQTGTVLELCKRRHRCCPEFCDTIATQRYIKLFFVKRQ